MPPIAESASAPYRQHNRAVETAQKELPMTRKKVDRTQSSLTNGTKLIDADGRSKQARRLRDQIARFTAEIGGGELSPVEEMLVRNAAVASVKSEEQQAKMAAGEDVSDEDTVRVGRMCSLAARDIATAKSKRKGVAEAAMSPLDKAIAEIEAKRVAEPVEEDDDEDEVEPVETIVEPEPVCTPSAPEPGDVEEEVAEPAKPQGPVAVWHDARPGVEPGKTLHQIVAALKARSIALVKFSTPHVSHTDCPIDRVIRDAGLLASKATWHVREVDLS